MATVGSLAYSIVANHKDFREGIKASRAELRTLRSAFLDTMTPVERFSGAIANLEALMAKFPSRSREITRSIAAMRAEMQRASNDRIRGIQSSARAAMSRRHPNDLLDAIDSGLAGQRGGGVASAAGRAERFLKLQQGATAANQAIMALRTGSILPLVGSLGTTGLAGAAIAAGAAIPVLTAKLALLADESKQAKEEFFEHVDALKALGENVHFADHVKRVRSLKSAWADVGKESKSYLATLIGRVEGEGGMLGGALSVPLGMVGLGSGPAQTLDMVSGGISGLNSATETFQQRRERMAMAMMTPDRLKRAQERRERLPGLREDAAADDLAHRKERMKEFAQLMERMADAERMAHDEKMRMLREHAAEVAKLADRMRGLIDQTRTPAEKLQERLKEIQDLKARGLDSDTAMRALRALEDEALGMIPGRGGSPQLKSQAAIRAGSVEALRAQFSGGTKEDKAADATIKTEKHTAEARNVLVEIRDAIKASGGIGVAE